MATFQTTDPSQMSLARQRMDVFMRMIHTILDGTYAMRRAGPLYLPPHPNETQAAYTARLERTTLLNALEDAIENACARLFDEQVRLEGDIPPELKNWSRNIDLEGTSLHEFCQRAMRHALEDGMVHIMVDYPSSNTDIPAGTGAMGDVNAYNPNAVGNGLDARRSLEIHKQIYGEVPDEMAASDAFDDPQDEGQEDDAEDDADQEDGEADDQSGVETDDPELYNGKDENDRGPQYEPSAPNVRGALAPGMSLAEERQLGNRPYLSLIPHKNMLAIYTERVRGETIVNHVRFFEDHVKREGFAEIAVKRVRVVEIGKWEVYEQSGAMAGVMMDGAAGSWSMIDQGEMAISKNQLWDRVPLVTFMTGKPKGPFEVKPPFLDLAYANIKHWQSSSDQTNILAQSRFPMLAVSGFEGTVETPIGDDDDDGPDMPRQMPFMIGPNAVLTTGDPGGKWYYVEPGGAAIAAGEKDLDRIEREMQAMGLEPLSPQSHATGLEAGIDEAKARSPLEEWARGLEFKMQMALSWLMQWAGMEGQPRVGMKSKVTLPQKGQSEMQQIQMMRQAGVISKLTYLEEAKRHGVLGPEFEPIEELGRLVIEGPFGNLGPYLGLPPSNGPDTVLPGGLPPPPTFPPMDMGAPPDDGSGAPPDDGSGGQPQAAAA